MSPVFHWKGNSITFSGGEDGGIFGHVCQEGTRWGWSVTSHCEGKDEPAVIAEGQESTRTKAVLAATVAYQKHAKKQAGQVKP